MFRSCRRKKKAAIGIPASGLSWKPIVEPNVIWPRRETPVLRNDTSMRFEAGTSKVSINTGKEVDLKCRQRDVPQKGRTTVEEDRQEEMKTIQVEAAKFAEVQNRENIAILRVSEQHDTVEHLESVQSAPPRIAKIENDNALFEVKLVEVPQPVVPQVVLFGGKSVGSETSTESKKANVPPQVDANDNHIPDVYHSKKKTHLDADCKESIVSLDSGNSATSGSDDTPSSSVSLGMTRRKAFRDDEEHDVPLVAQHLTQAEEAMIRKALNANDFIRAVAPNAIEDIARYMRLIDVRKGAVIMQQGEQGDSMYVSKSGEFKVQMHKRTIHKFKEARLFGELAILYDKPRHATVLALSDGAVWRMERRVFKVLLRQSNITASDAVLEFLRRVPVINAATPPKLRQIADLCETRFYAKGTAIVREGQRGDEFFIVKTGRAVVSKMGQGRIKTYVPGDFFGERALLYDEDKRKATVTAQGYGVECLVLRRDDFNQYLGDVRRFLEERDESRSESQLAPPVVTPDANRFAPYRAIRLAELKKVKLLGEGGFGLVHLVKTARGRQFALKEMKIKQVDESQSAKKAFNERDIQKACDSIFIVQLYRTFSDDVNIYFLLEYCPRAELFTLLRKRRKQYFDDPLATFTAACVLEALAYLHARRCAFLDLKPENIFIDRDGYAKIGDFGNAVHLEVGAKCYEFAGTLEYMAPEIIKLMGTDMAADYWAMGVLIYEMLMGRSPFADKTEEATLDNIIRGLTAKHFVPNFNRAAKDLIKRLMDVNPAKRLGCLRAGINGLYRHEWFKDIDFVRLRTKSVKSPLLSLYKR